MSKLGNKIQSLENFKVLKDYLPDEIAKKMHLAKLASEVFKLEERPLDILDLGCGEGNSAKLFKEITPTSNWHGVDIEDSPEVRRREFNTGKIKNFDGVNLPYSDHSIDLIYCNQVLEHVRYPDKLISEAMRVLKSGGRFLGAVSYLEPFHSFSIFNFTPYGVIRVFEDAGFVVEQIQAGSDASHMINRQIFNRSGKFRFIWNRDYLHGLANIAAKLGALGGKEHNFLRVQLAGHLVFSARTQ